MTRSITIQQDDASWLARELSWQIQRNEALLLSQRNDEQVRCITEEIDIQARILGALK